MADKKEDCPACHGSGKVAFATEVMDCAACDGKGTLPPKVAEKIEKDLAQEGI